MGRDRAMLPRTGKAQGPPRHAGWRGTVRRAGGGTAADLALEGLSVCPTWRRTLLERLLYEVCSVLVTRVKVARWVGTTHSDAATAGLG